nr:ATP-binding cassette transporter Abcb1-3 [Brachionus angularis]
MNLKNKTIKIDGIENEKPKKIAGNDSEDDKKENKSFMQKIFKKKKDEKTSANLVPFLKLFRFADKLDCLFIFIGTVGGMANGAMLPLVMYVFSKIIDSFSSYNICDLNNFNTSNSTNQTLDYGSLLDKMKDQAIYLVLLGIGTMVLGYFQVAFWIMAAERQVKKIRQTLFGCILKQNIGWFDTYKSGELTNRLTDDVNKIKDGIGDKLGNAIQYVSTFLVAVIISLVKGWKLTLVILSISPLLFCSSFLFTKLTGILTSNELKSYASAGAVAEEVFSAIRTVFAFNGVKREHKRYEDKLDEAKIIGIKKGFVNGIMMGSLWLVINSSYALGFWYGWKLSEQKDSKTGEPEYTIGKILLVFFNIIIGVFSLGNAGPLAGNLANAKGAAYEIFNIIDRKPPIDSSSDEGEKPKNLIGDIEFDNVHFNYPSRPNVKILNGLSIKIKTGTTVALVGASGCGKSTCIQLIQRFYDPIQGLVKIDNVDIKKLNIKWLRSIIGVVNQEPILFATTIKENIRFGRDDATDEEIILAAKNANAHDFIMTLPDKYETLVGERGSQMSGGQKQRIAIARALVRNPKILLLDEATSALDNESESIVQAALDKASEGRTTLIVAHRLSTILNADVIFAFENGEIKEIGTHSELMNLKGIYYNLVINQQSGIYIDNKNKKKIKIDEIKNEQTNSLGQTKTNSNKDNSKDDDKSKKKESFGTKIKFFKKVMSLNKPEWYIIVIGCIASLISGGVQPTFSIILSKAVGAFLKCSYKERKDDITLFCVLFFIIGIITLLSNLIQSAMFGISGENLTKRLRSEGFKKMLSQEVGWFDSPDNNVGVLCTKLAVEASAVQGATGVRLGFFLMNFGNFGIGLIISFVYGWTITLLILSFVPFMIISGGIQTKMLAGFSGKDKIVIEEAGKITNEAISNIRTVVILNKEKYFLDKYIDKIKIPYKSGLKSANVNGVLLGFTTSILFYAIAASYTLGAYLVEKQKFGMSLERIMLVFGCIMFGAQAIGQASSLLPDYAKAKSAIHTMFELFDRIPKINNWETNDGLKINESEFGTNIKLERIEFTYPSRPEAKILNNLSLEIKEGQRVAFVGSSGCGKSTITQLLERFYDPDNGKIIIGNNIIKDYNLHWLRSQIGIVSQEPTLFDMSIYENIAYGINSRKVSLDEVIQAAKNANIHDFISQLPKGYDTNVGSKGTQLSGGQKQRIAIARALIRNPKILLLDEATSALDTESEKIVQDALDKAQHGRTCIIIAHRLSTIKNSDLIFVLQNGIVTEKGTHDELINLNGFYAKLNGQQEEAE